MIVGSGLLARSFSPSIKQRDEVCIYAAGVSNSSCTEICEFEREKSRLVAALHVAKDVDAFVYFGTCSVYDGGMLHTPYVQHKLAMEKLVMAHPRSLILRLPQVAGDTPNPHTLLNFLYNRIARSEQFSLWRNAYRNIIDVDDVSVLAEYLIADPTMRRRIFNLANTRSYNMLEIIRGMEEVIGKQAIYDIQDCGYHYEIDVSEILSALDQTSIHFDSNYLIRVLRKYYDQS